MLDKLTGGLNRKFLEAALDARIETAKATGSMFSIIMSDLDKFKSINDVYGHQTGDMVIATTGKTIRSNLRKGTPFGRYGGEEFMVILDHTSAEDALAVAEKLRKAIESAKMLGEKRDVTGSMGVATFDVRSDTKTSLIEKADRALYKCKEGGRNRCELYDPLYKIAAETTSKAQGIITGDTIKDALRIRMTLDVIEFMKDDAPYDEKTNMLLSRLKEIAGAESVAYMAADDTVIGKEFNYSLEGEGDAALSIMTIPLEKGGNISGSLRFQALAAKATYRAGNDDFAGRLRDLAEAALALR